MLKPSLLLAGLLLMNLSCTKKATTDGNDRYPGYQLLQKNRVETISSDVVEMQHKKSGATVVLIKNDDPARSFMAGFRTPPYDDTGLFHIFEHAVLEGSRLYPSKSNFFHLANSSVASFINAMTGPVYTLYPFVTRSTIDFNNLLMVYLDAVFFPNVLEDERIIRREGWRYEVDPAGEDMSINGIVLSEMKGAFASPYRSIWFQLGKALIPESPYSYSSGGLPEKVATLTFEQIQQAHKKYYHPQNSVIYLYGDLKYREVLRTIDEKFLSHFTKTEDYQRPAIPVQKSSDYPTPVVEATYPGQPEPNKDFLGKGYVLGPELSDVEKDAVAVLLQAFAEKNAAPLKLRAMQEGLAKTTFSTRFGGDDNGVAFVFEGSNAHDRTKIDKMLNAEIEKVAQKGIDPEWLTAILNKYEFAFKEKNSNGSHKGMQLGSIVLNNWIFQDKPLHEALDFVAQFKKLRAQLADQDFVKSIFKKYFLNNDRSRWVVLTPDPKFSEKFNAGLERQVQQALTEKPIEAYAKADQEYRQWVAAKESEEVVQKTPTLELTDIEADEEPIPMQKETLGQTQVLLYPQDTSGISYLNLYFDLRGVPAEDLRNLSFFTDFIKKTDSKNKSFQDLEKELDTFVGGLGFATSTYQSVKDPQQYRPTLSVSLSFLNENREKVMELLQELITGAQFAPTDRLKNLVDEVKTNMISGISYRAPSLSMQAAAKSFFPNQGAFSEETSGGVFENYVMQTVFDGETLQKKLQAMLGKIFNQQRLYLTTITSDKQDLGTLQNSVGQLKTQLPESGSPNQTWSFEQQENYDGFAIPGEVQYLAQVTSYKKQGLEYDGSMEVYSQYLNNHFMTPKLREQAGAYGGSASFSRNGLFRMSTYRDPNLQKSYETFSEAVDFMKNEKFDKEKLKPAILGSLKPYYRDTSVSAKTGQMTYLHLTDQTWEDYMEVKKEIVSTTPKEIHRISKILEKALPESQKAVAGNSGKIKAEAPFLKNVLSIQ
jgi:Zn-dependent M16 (insulinase) family peptidase